MRYLLLFILFLISASAFAQDSLFVTTSDSVKLFVKRSGKGVPVLFIHGGPGSNSIYFEYEGGNVFEKDVEMIYLDQRGCGRSSSPKNKDYSLQRIARDFEEVRQALKIKQWVLMPHSFGGILATEYATMYPGAVKGMVYLNCTVDLNASARSGINKTIEILPNLKQNEIEYLLNQKEPILNRFFNAFWHLGQNRKTWQLMFDKQENYLLDSAIISRPGLNWEMGSNVFRYPEYMESHSPKTANIKAPVLIISGTRDFTIGIDHPTLLLFPNKKVHYIAGGHALYLEHNKELYDIVGKYLRELR